MEKMVKLSQKNRMIRSLFLFLFFTVFLARLEAQQCSSKPAVQFPHLSVQNGQVANALMNGVSVTRDYSHPTKPVLVYGNTDAGTYCSGTPYHHYSIIHTHVDYSPKVIYTFSKPVKEVEAWLMVMGSSAGGHDEVRISTNNGTPTFTKVYDCVKNKGGAEATLTGGLVVSKNGAANINDVAIRVSSAVPFTKLIVEDVYAHSSGVLVELCPTSVKPIAIDFLNQPSDVTVCKSSTTVFTSKVKTEGITVTDLKYQWQYSADNGANWIDISSAKGVLPATGEAKLTLSNIQDTQNNYLYRTLFSYTNAGNATVSMTTTSTAAKLTVNVPEVTQITAAPLAFKQGENTSVVFTITGTPNAQVTYKIGAGAEQQTILDSTGKKILPAITVNQTTELKVTKVKLGACETITDKTGRVIGASSKCYDPANSIIRPSVQFPTSPAQGQTSLAPMNGVNVTRIFAGTPKVITVSMYRFCSTQNYAVGYTLVEAGGKVTYKFDKPIKSAEIWLMLMGDPGGYDKMKLSVNGTGNTTFVKVYDCQNNATVANDGTVTSVPASVTDIAVKVSSDRPFTELSVQDILVATGALVELCPASVEPADIIAITQQPQNQTACQGGSTVLTSKAILKDVTGNVQ